MSAKFTRGPWYRTGTDPKGWEWISSGGSVPIASVYPQGAVDDVHKANARLIAAAPELYEACRAAQELIRVARRYFPKSIKNSHTWQMEVASAELGKALAKAEGSNESK